MGAESQFAAVGGEFEEAYSLELDVFAGCVENG
jgi:hypothetical protein